METAHNQPGRRFAQGSTRGDQLVGIFGLASHFVTAFAIMAGACWLYPDAACWLCLGNGILAGICLAVRAWQVGATTTRESVQAIRDAWL